MNVSTHEGVLGNFVFLVAMILFDIDKTKRTGIQVVSAGIGLP